MSNKNLESPIFKDSRGQINRYEIDGQKFNVLTTKAGVYRSGDYHKATQYDIILKGEFEITFRQNDKDVIFKKSANDLLIIPPNTPHLFNSLTDTVMIEWWDGPFEAKYYEPYRKIINRQLEKNNNG